MRFHRSVRLVVCCLSVGAVSACSGGGGSNGSGGGGNTGTLQFSANAFSGVEGTAVTLSVTRSGGTSGAASVTCASTGGTATTGQDYSAVNTTLSWADGDGTSKTCDVALSDDTDIDPGETITVTLSNATGATLGSPSTATVTITDTDSPGTLGFANSVYIVYEANGTTNIPVARSGGTGGSVSVTCAPSGGTAVSGTHYSMPSQTLTWAAGDTADKVCQLTALDNGSNDEPNRTVQLALSNVTGGATLGTTTATVTINDDPGVIRFSGTDFSALEGETKHATVNRVGGKNGQVSVSFKALGTVAFTQGAPAETPASYGAATSPSDYELSPGSVTWSNGDDAPKQITFSAKPDGAVEGPETFQLALCDAVGTNVGSIAGATVTINELSSAVNPAPGLGNLIDNKSGPVPSNLPIDITFTELLDPNPGNINNAIRVEFETNTDPGPPYTCTGSVDLVCVVPGSVTYDEPTRTLSFVPSAALHPDGGPVTVRVGSVQDTSGAASSPASYPLTVENGFSDTERPTVQDIYTETADGTRSTNEQAVAVDARMVAIIRDYMINTTTLNPNTIKLSHVVGTETRNVAGRVVFARPENGIGVQDTTVKFVPACSLQPNTNYTLTLTTGIRDAVRNTLLAEQAFSFKTAP